MLIFGDDQYENFREDIIPAFCVMGLDQDFSIKPWAGGRANRWNEPADWEMKLHGQRDVAKFLARALIDRGIDMSYAYKPLHQEGLAHAFTNTLLYLDWDRKGFPWPVLPFAVNCYGSNLIHAKGGMAALFIPPQTDAPDPPAPQPWRCMEVGKAIAEVLAEVAVSGRGHRLVELVALLPVADQRLSVAGPSGGPGDVRRVVEHRPRRSGAGGRASRWSRPASTKCSTGWR